MIVHNITYFFNGYKGCIYLYQRRIYLMVLYTKKEK